LTNILIVESGTEANVRMWSSILWRAGYGCGWTGTVWRRPAPSTVDVVCALC